MTRRPQPHLRVLPGDMASRVVLVRRPEQVEELATVLDGAEHRARGRGYLTVSGRFAGVDVSLLSVGLGGPSVSIAVEEAIAVGARQLVHLETLLTVPGGPVDTDVLIHAARRQDGTSRQYFPDGMPAVADHDLLERALTAFLTSPAGVEIAQVRTVDRIYGAMPDAGGADVRCLDMVAGLLYPLALARGAAAVAIGRSVDLARFARGLDGEPLARLGEVALRALVGGSS